MPRQFFFYPSHHSWAPVYPSQLPALLDSRPRSYRMNPLWEPPLPPTIPRFCRGNNEITPPPRVPVPLPLPLPVFLWPLSLIPVRALHPRSVPLLLRPDRRLVFLPTTHLLLHHHLRARRVLLPPSPPGAARPATDLGNFRLESKDRTDGTDVNGMKAEPVC